MRKILGSIAVLIFAIISNSPTAQAESTAERLGFAPTDKVLLIHADDFGIFPAENKATIDLLSYGLVKSSSVMMPTPAVGQVLTYLRSHPEADLGIHSTFTSEIKGYRWSSISDPKRVWSLIDEEGSFWSWQLPAYFTDHIEHLEDELRAQIESALEQGFSPTHLDTHMGLLFMKGSWMKMYLRVAHEFKIPPLFPRWSEDFKMSYGEFVGSLIQFSPNREVLDQAVKNGFLPVDYFIQQVPGTNLQDRRASYIQVLKNLKPGLTELLIHPTYSDDEQSRIILQTNANQRFREADAIVFQDPEIKALIEQLHIHLVGWKQIGQAYHWDEVKDLE